MQEVVEGSRARSRPSELGPAEFDRSTPRLVGPDTRANLERLFLETDWTDRLPIVLPTEERVAGHAAGTQPQARRGRGAHALHALPRVLGVHVEKVAVNAVMAGRGPSTSR
jgi:hypothetical protein